jgi:hypothetical protein
MLALSGVEQPRGESFYRAAGFCVLAVQSGVVVLRSWELVRQGRIGGRISRGKQFVQDVLGIASVSEDGFQCVAHDVLPM